MAHGNENGRARDALKSSKSHLSQIWVSFKSCTGRDVTNGKVILEVITESSKEFSPIIRTSSSGKFLNTVNSVLKTEEEYSFVLYKVEPKQDRPLKIDNIKFSVCKNGRSLIHFNLDVPALAQKVMLSKQSTVTQTISSSEGYSLKFTASKVDPSIDDDDVASVSSFLDDENNVSDQISSSDQSEAESWWSSAATAGSSNDSRLCSPNGLRVRFDSDIHEIPTTKQLQDEITQAVEERSKLSKNVEDLSLQLFQVKHELRDVQESLRKVTEVLGARNRKQDMRTGKESPGKVPKRRRVVLDGNVIAKAYGGGHFSVEGIGLALNYYLSRDINAVAVVSDGRVLDITEAAKGDRNIHDKERLRNLIQKGLLSITPSQTKRELFMLKFAIEQKADIVSNQSFRSVVEAQSSRTEQRRLKSFLHDHRIPFSFIGGKFIPNPQSDNLSSSLHAAVAVERSDTL